MIVFVFPMTQLSTSRTWEFLREPVELGLPFVVGSLIFLACLHPLGPRFFFDARKLPLAEHQLEVPT